MSPIFQHLERQRILPAIVLPTASAALPCATALFAGGIEVLEITFRSADAAQSVRHIRSELPQVTCGAGTLLSPRDIDAAVSAGAQFGLSPGFNPTVVRAAVSAGFPFIPGVQTAGEMEQALELGCPWVKFFPAEAAGGIRFLQAVMPPYLHTPLRIVPLGGINPSNLQAYLQLPYVPAVGGSWLTPKDLLLTGRYSEITEISKKALSLARTDVQK